MTESEDTDDVKDVSKSNEVKIANNFRPRTLANGFFVIWHTCDLINLNGQADSRSTVSE